MKTHIALICCALALSSCNRVKSDEPGKNPPGAGAGQRGGANDGEAAGKTPPVDPKTNSGILTPPRKR
jgi:hypothetical protein